MTGGPPVFFSPAQHAPQGYPATQWQQPRAQTPKPSTVRGQMPSKEQPRPRAGAALAPLAIPTPEQLGVGTTRTPAPAPAVATTVSAEVDWTATRKKLQELGAVSFRLDRLPAGRARFQVWLSGQAAAIQADGASEFDAVRDCLDRARTQVAVTR